MPSPYHSSRFDYPNIMEWEVQIIKLLIMKFSTMIWLQGFYIHIMTVPCLGRW
jgi:hypothetical protein